MAIPLSQAWSRLTRMGWHELRTRVGQEIGKRIDVARFRCVMLSPRWNDQPAFGGSFFFAPADLRTRTQLLSEHLGSEVANIIRDADEICRHRFQLLGYTGLDFGSEIDWHLDPVHGKRSPLKPWYKIDFLDFGEVGDHKVIWELNRHQHLVVLAKAWCLTQRGEYVTELVRQWYAWQEANLYPLGINWASSLEVALRGISWLWIRLLLSDCPFVPPAFYADISTALAIHGRHIERYLSTYFSPNTHLLGEGMALFFLGTLLPQIPSAPRWRSRGWSIVLAAAQRQVLPDGVHFEHSLYYHIYALDFFLHARTLATHNGIEIPGEFDRVLNRMLDVVHALSQGASPVSFGDDDGGRVFNPHRNRAEYLTDTLVLGALAFGRTDRNPAGLTEEALWLFGERAVTENAKHSAPEVEGRSVAFPAGGIYVMADSGLSCLRMVVDAGSAETGHGGHGHAGALSMSVAFAGRPWLVDAGTFCYVASDNERDYFRGTGAHNTLRVDGLDQAIPCGPFAWSELPRVRTECWLAGATFALFIGSHTGYARLADPVVHRRIMFHLHGGFWLVRDVAVGKQFHRLETSWHFAPDLKVAPEGESLVASLSPSSSAGKGNRLVLLPVNDSRWHGEIAISSISPVYGMKASAAVVRFSAHVPLPAQHAVAVVPLVSTSGKCGELMEVAPGNSPAGDVTAYRYQANGKTHHMIFGETAAGTAWSHGPWTSDAKFLYVGASGAAVRHLVICGGSFLKLFDQAVVHHAREFARFEWLNNNGTRQIYSSDEIAAPSISEEVLGRCDLAI